MLIAQQIAILNREEELARNENEEQLFSANYKSESKKTIQFINELLNAVQSKKGFKEFAFFVANNSEVQQKLQESPNKSRFKECLVQVCKEYGYEFTEEKVTEIPNSWDAISAEELLSKLVDWGKGSFQQFLTDIKNEPRLKKELDKSRDRNNFVTFLKNTFNQPERQEKYQWLTERDIEESANLIPSEEKRPEPEKPAKVQKIVGRIWC